MSEDAPPTSSVGEHPDAGAVDARLWELIDHAAIGIVEFDLAGRAVYVNAHWRSLTGIEDPTPIDGQRILEAVHPADRARMTEQWLDAQDAAAGYLGTLKILHPDGEVRSAQTRTEPLVDEHGALTGWVASIVDITTALRLDAEERRQRYDDLHHAAIGKVILDLDLTILEVNPAFAELCGRTPAALIGTSGFDLVHPDDVERVAKSSAPVLAGEIDFAHDELRVVRTDGTAVWIASGMALVRSIEGEPRYVQATVFDVDQRRRAEDRARQLAQIVEATSDVIGTLDPKSGHLLYLNRASRELFGLADVDIGAIDARALYTETSARVLERDVAVALEMGRTWTGELDMVSGAGTVLHVTQTISADLDDTGAIRQIAFVGRDVTAERRRQVELAHMAAHDPLTDLPNRGRLLELIEAALAGAPDDGPLVGLLLFDLDRFKTVNDSLGHEAGDDLLRHVADRISAAVRPGDVLCRVGGDEFVVLCPQVQDEEQAIALTQRITGALESRPFAVDGAAVTVTASVGIALSTDREAHAEALLRNADAAMYRAKDRGRARHELFDDEMRRRSRRRIELADELALAIERGQINVHYQPIVDLRDGRVGGVEALARWEHPERGTLPPWEFIGLAEETGLIVGLGLSVLSRACDQVRRWEVELGNRAPKVHVNLSARQLTAANLPRLVEGVIDQSLIGPERLCLEVTESVLMEDAAASTKALTELKAIGVELAIDDFGTGYSSLAYLQRFPVDVLKIDRSFVDGLGPDPDDSRLVSVIVNLADALGLSCVAEGVETAEQLAALRALGCEEAQGYYFARPQPVPDVNRYLTTTFQVNGTPPR